MNIGIDIIKNERLKNISGDINKIKKIFTLREIDYFEKFSDKIPHIAGFFCAKEAVAKALKCGFGNVLSPIDVEILHEESGAPYVFKNEKIKKLLKNRQIDISISNEKQNSIAVCIVY